MRHDICTSISTAGELGRDRDTVGLSSGWLHGVGMGLAALKGGKGSPNESEYSMSILTCSFGRKNGKGLRRRRRGGGGGRW